MVSREVGDYVWANYYKQGYFYGAKITETGTFHWSDEVEIHLSQLYWSIARFVPGITGIYRR